ncbi:hypothetical protein DIPPA_22203 [Diplonema papillatum]|nr:hypothetical protein DIPPA_22203 [Diplonema papillatum]
MEKKYVAFGATLALSTAGLLIALLPMDVGGPAAGAEQDAAAVSRAELRVSVSTGSQLQFGDPAQTGRRAVGVSGGEGREPDGAHTHAPTQPDGGRVQAGRSRPRYHILVPWGRQRVSATTPLPTAETCAVLREADCVFEHRDDWSGPPGSPSDKQLALARADLVMIDTNTKMKDDKRYYDVEANPLHKTLGVLNIENVWGRMPAWLSKWKVRWFGRANETAWWDRFAVVVSFEEHAIIPYRYWHAANRDLFLKHKRTRLADKNLRSAAFIASNCWTRFQTTSGFDRDAEVRNLSQVRTLPF